MGRFRHVRFLLIAALSGAAVLGSLRCGLADEQIDAGLAQVLRDLKHADPQVSLIAMMAIKGTYGPRAEAAIPTLIELVKSDPQETVHDTWQAKKALAAIGHAAVPEVLKLLNSENATWRAEAAVTIQLGLAHRHPDAVVPALTAAISDPEPLVRYESIRALWGLGSKAKAAVPAIALALHDPDSEVCRMAMRALASIGSAAGSAVPVLVDHLDREEIAVRGSAVVTLGRIGPNAHAATDKLIPLLRHETLREEAADALRRIGITKRHVPTLIEFLDHQNARTRQLAALTLARVGADAAPAVDTLMRSLDDPQMLEFALHALGRIGPRAAPSVPRLIMLLTHDTYFIQAGAAEALGRIGPDAEQAIPALEKAANDGNPLLRKHANQALNRIVN